MSKSYKDMRRSWDDEWDDDSAKKIRTLEQRRQERIRKDADKTVDADTQQTR